MNEIYDFEVDFKDKDVSTCLNERLNPEEWFNKACQDCTNHVSASREIRIEAALTDDDIKLWKTFLPISWWKNKRNNYEPELDDSIREHIKKFKKDGIFERIEVWSNGIDKIEDLIVVGLREKNYFHIASQHNGDSSVKNLNDVKTRVSQNLKHELHRFSVPIIVGFLAITILLSTMLVGFIHIIPISMKSFCADYIGLTGIILLLFLALISLLVITLKENEHIRKQKKIILTICNQSCSNN